MAYQPKSYRKFLATSVAAAVVVTAAAPAALAAPADAKFSDVSSSHWAIDDINYLVEKGAIQGYPDGTFKPGNSITRAEMAVVLAKTLELDVDPEVTTDKFSDVPATHWANPFIAAIVDQTEGVIDGYENGTFRPTNTVTRQEMAKMVVEAYNLELVEGKDLPFTDVDGLWSTDYINILASNGVAAGITTSTFVPRGEVKRDQTTAFIHRAEVEEERIPVKDLVPTVSSVTVVDATTLTVVLSNGTTHEVTLDTALVANEATEVTFEINDVEYTETVTWVYEAPAVASVTALNATQVEVKFTTAVDKADAELAGNSSIQGVNISSRSLSEDGKVLTLTANAAIDVKDAAVVVEPIKTKADSLVKTEKYVSLLTYKDEVAPTISSVEAKTNSTRATSLTVKASEPVKSGALVKVNGTYATVDFNGTDTATITGLSLPVGETHSIELINLEDLAGNKTVSTTANFTVSVDAVAPTATLTAKGDNQILVTFSKSMDAATVTSALVNGSVKNEALANVETGAPSVVADTNNTQFVIPVTDPLYSDKNTRTLNVVLPNSIEDSLGNKLEASTQTVTLTKDTVKPVATGYNVIKDTDGKVTALEVHFSEGLKAVAAEGVTAPSVVNENGVAVTSFLGGLKSKAVVNGDKKVVFEATTPAEVNGKYAFTFANELVSDLAQTANKSAGFNYTIDFGQGESVTTFDVTSATALSNVITVTFPEAVRGGAVANSATDINNYSLAGKPLPTGTTITLDSDQKVATIVLPSESVAKDDIAAVFTVSNIKNTAGTKTSKTFTGTVEVRDNTAPVLTSAKALDNKTIELTYNEAINLDGADVGADFTILEGTTAVTLAASELKASQVSGFPTRIRLTIDAAKTLDLTKDITIETEASTIVKDDSIARNTQKVEVKVTVQKP